MNGPIIRDCQIDPERLLPIEFATADCDPGRPDREWSGSTLSNRTVAYSCGALCRAGDTLEHCHDPAELELCRRLSAEAAQIMEGIEIGMGDESGGYFHPFFVAANVGAPAPPVVNEEVIRTAFNGTIYPHAAVEVEPLDEERGYLGTCLEEFRNAIDHEEWIEDGHFYACPVEDPENVLEHWRALIRWFQDSRELHGASLVMIGWTPLNRADRSDNIGSIHPRLVVGLTEGGSLVGIAGCVAHT
jgi:hypothetical protein